MTGMFVQRPLMLLAALATASAFCHQAHAEAHSKVSLGNYQYTLTDLDLTDGIDPSIALGPGVMTQSVSASMSNGVGSGGGPNSIASSSVKKTYEVPLGTPKSLAYQGFAVSSDAGSMSASADILAGGGTWSLLAMHEQAFVLSPHTAITFTAAADIEHSVVVPPGSVIYGPYGNQNGYFDWAPIQVDGKAFLTVGNDALSALGSSPPCWGDRCQSMDYLQDFMRSYNTGEHVQGKLLSLTVSNDSSGTLSKTLSAVAYTNGYATAPLALVPESSTWAMMGLGLVGIGGAIVRRRQAVSLVVKAPSDNRGTAV
ncbi:PEP-CTERM sorting domain-containing protein [Aquabacterium sp.]|uniref:PEP-CTERM sorting domain-containing protein n=1 Tax=Aquabacterium sp. TaxID=1872578 RepID=UPI00248A3CDE|nr:PEP-CTERM sorting domain-containing protein [Aquabacterium sp.]MDI1259997.1 PEP-CTERM sorting domain-containing protein [Aquabacterium sp.]